LPIANGGTGTTSTTFANLTTNVTGTLPVANGGTGVTSAAAITALVGNLLFPVGAIYTATVSTNPATLLGFGTWTAFGAGRVLIGDGGGFSAGATGGSADAITVSHTHTATSTDAGHNHQYARNQTPTAGVNPLGIAASSYDGNNNGSITVSTGFASITTTISSTGSSGTNANLQPYIVVYMWQRTA
jgi:hypothetical protein